MNKPINYKVGLDFGTSSLGWSAIQLDEKNNSPVSLLNVGVRIFNPGMKDLDTSNPTTSAQERRTARQSRRQTDRRARRKRKVFYFLKKKDMISTDETQATFTERVDRQTVAKYFEKGVSEDYFHHVVPYFLRAKALDKSLTIDELARVFYHFSQRRGFLSSRKDLKKNDELGKVKGAISELSKEMEDMGSRTLGEHFYKTNPMEKRIRTHYTSRQMYLNEFELIFKAQQAFHPVLLTDEFQNELFKALFFQRRLKSARHLVGTCELESKPGQKYNPKGCPKWHLEAQRFRIYQSVNNLKIIHSETGPRNLSENERQTILDHLEWNKELTFAGLKKMLKLEKGIKINLEEGGEKRILGNKTNHEMNEVFGDRWLSMSDEQKGYAIHDAVSIQKFDQLKKCGLNKWALNEDQAVQFSQVNLEDGYLRISLRAIRKLLPYMIQGQTYPEAVKAVYGEFHVRVPVTDYLPMIDNSFMELTNPVVKKCLVEARKAVNALIKEYGKPAEIHIELARDIKSSKAQRENAIKKNRDNEKERDKAAKYLQEQGILTPTRNDITKYQLAEECHWQDPYTGKIINHNSLFGENPEFDIEHIIPLSRSLDDSYANKTLCHVYENRHRKGNKTPYEAYSGSPETYEIVKMRVKKFSGKLADEKYRRFLLSDISEFEDFPDRLLNDTRYASRLAQLFLSSLYGGTSDSDGKKRIFCNSGSITAYLRQYFKINNVLGGNSKNRLDHRHHAVDAIVIALTTDGSIKMLSNYAKTNWVYGRPSIKQNKEPWPGFLDEVRASVLRLNVIHRKGNKVRGALHKETIYGKTGNDATVSERIPLEKLPDNDVPLIKDKLIREQVEKKMLETGKKIKDLFAKTEENEPNYPVIRSKDGDEVKVRAVHIEYKQKTLRIGKAGFERKVANKSNHHMEIVAVLDATGKETKWEGFVVTMLEAYRRKREKEPIIRRDFGPGRKFKFSLAEGALIEIMDNNEKKLFVVRTVPKSLQIMYVPINSAGQQKDLKATGNWLSKTPNTLFQAGGRKVILTNLGEVRYAND